MHKINLYNIGNNCNMHFHNIIGESMTKKQINLVPYPQKINIGRGSFSIDNVAVLLDRDAKSSVAVRHKLKTLGLKASVGDVGNYTVIIGAPDLSRLRPPQHDEAYLLRCDSKGVVICGYDLDGLFWGLVTLEQLIAGSRVVPCLEIRDHPAFGLRYHHDDISRKQISKLSDFKRIIRLLSSYKIKYYTLHIEAVFYLKSFPDIGETRGRLTPAEVKGILAEAKRYNVTIFPTFSLIGHQENILSNPKYRKYAQEVFMLPSSYDPSKKILRPYLKKVIADVCELFPDAPYFHAGFDETQGVEENDLIEHANWCAGEIAKHGKKMMMWTDMFKNHYGLKKIHKLASNIATVEWLYENPKDIEQAYLDADVTPSGLAGYDCWCTFMPNYRASKKNITGWAKVMKKWGGEGFGCAIWGDNGYENSRDLCWNLYAFNAEVSWRGKSGPTDFEFRFQNSFYGKPLPMLSKIIGEVSDARKIPPRKLWELFRTSEQGMIRLLADNSKLATDARYDKKLLSKAMRYLNQCRKQALREQAHLDHFEVALMREINVLDRIILAERLVKGLGGARRKAAVESELAKLDIVKVRYKEVWLRHNKRQNIEVSLAVYDRVAQGLKDLIAPAPTKTSKFIELSPAPYANILFKDVAGIPLGRKSIDGVPFEFVPINKTHIVIAPGDKVLMPFADEPKPIKDIHLIYGGQTFEHKDFAEFVEVALVKDGKVVFSERLKNIKDICCWWAPMGEHMWAGGGYRHVNKKRNSPALVPGIYYGLMHLSGFRIKAGIKADSLRITGVGKETLALFAATVEVR